MAHSQAINLHQVGHARNQKILFRNLDLRIENYNILQIVGPNGSGKSSLLKLLAGFAEPDQGQISWVNQGRALKLVYNHDYQKNLAYLGHSPALKDYLTVEQQLNFAAKLYGVSSAKYFAELEHFGLANFRQRHCYQLSAGQQQRLALLIVKISQRLIWILDEPFTKLDLAGIDLISAELLKHSESGGVVIFTSHHCLSDPRVINLRLGV